MERAPKTIVIQDLTGYGRCAMSVALPVLAAMGCQCCCIPTAYLSAHTGFPPSERAVLRDMTGELTATAEHWGELGVEADAIYTGFLSSPEQALAVGEAIGRFRRSDTLVLVDPVMGDHGRAYRTCTPALRERVAALARGADLIVPNLTEAAFLLGEDYCAAPGPDRLREWLKRLSLEGRRSVVITGVTQGEDTLGAACLDRSTGRISMVMARREGGQFPGTGDLFAGVLLGGLLRREELPTAAERAVTFVGSCVRRTLELGTPVLEGVQFEGALGELIER